MQATERTCDGYFNTLSSDPGNAFNLTAGDYPALVYYCKSPERIK